MRATPKQHRRVAALIYNPVKVDGARLRKSVRAAATVAGWAKPIFYETTRQDPGQEATASAVAAGAEVVLVAGGDGTVRAVAEAAADAGVPLAIVPSGTGNLLARNLGLPLSSPMPMIEAAFAGETLPVDIGLADVTRPDGSTEQHAFVVMAGMGLDAAMIQNTRPKLKRTVGWVAYLDGAARSLTKVEPFHVVFQLSDLELHRTRTHSILWANCGKLPAGISLLPGASITDGLLDVALFQPRRWWNWFTVWRTVWLHNSVLRRTELGRRVFGEHAGSGAVNFYQGSWMSASVESPQPIEFDGDELGEAIKLHGRIEPGGLLVKVPQGTRLLASPAATATTM